MSSFNTCVRGYRLAAAHSKHAGLRPAAASCARLETNICSFGLFLTARLVQHHVDVQVCCCTHSDLAGLVESSHPVPHVGHIVALEEVPPGNCIDDYRERDVHLVKIHNCIIEVICEMTMNAITAAQAGLFLMSFSQKLTKAELCLWLLLRRSFIHLRREEEKRRQEE